MSGVRDRACEWLAAGRRVAAATVIEVDGSAPFSPGAVAIVNERGEMFGSVSIGCAESAVAQEAREVLRTGKPSAIAFDAGGDELGGISLLCGGRVRVQIAEIFSSTDIGEAEQPEAVVLFIAGYNEYARVLAELGRHLGLPVTIVDPRASFAGAGVRCEWPDETIAQTCITEDTAIVLMSHDTRYDVPFLTKALQSSAFYVGALGSRRTHSHRVERLVRAGVPWASIERIHAPAGLDLGGRSPRETALAILAEIVAVRHARCGRPLKDSEGPIHDPRPRTATDPRPERSNASIREGRVRS